MVDAYKKGKLKNPPEKIKEVSKHISAEDTKHFAKTKHKGLPEHVKKAENDKQDNLSSLAELLGGSYVGTKLVNPAIARLIGAKRIYHGTSDEAAQAIRNQGYDPSIYGGSNKGNTKSFANDVFNENAKGHAYYTSAPMRNVSQEHALNAQMKARGEKSYYDQIGEIRSNNPYGNLFSPSKEEQEVGSKILKDLTLGSMNPFGKSQGTVLEAYIPHKDFKSNFEPDPDALGNMIPGIHRTRKKIEGKNFVKNNNLFGRLKTMMDARDPHILEYIKRSPGRFGRGVALATTALGAGGVALHGAKNLAGNFQKKESLWKELGEAAAEVPARIGEYIPFSGIKTQYSKWMEQNPHIPEQIKHHEESMLTNAESQGFEPSEDIRRETQDKIEQLQRQNRHYNTQTNSGWLTALGLGATPIAGAGLYDAIQPQQKQSMWNEIVKLAETEKIDVLKNPKFLFASYNAKKVKPKSVKNQIKHVELHKPHHLTFARDLGKSYKKEPKSLFNFLKKNPIKATGIGLVTAGLATAGARHLLSKKEKDEPKEQEKKAILGAGLYDSITKQPQEQPMQQKMSLWKEAIRGDYARAALGALEADDWDKTNVPSQGLQDYSKGSRHSKVVADLIRTKRKTDPDYLFQQRNLAKEVLRSLNNQDPEEMNSALKTKLTPKENAWWLTPAAERDDAWDAKHRPRTVEYRTKQKILKEKQVADDIINKRNDLKKLVPHHYNPEHPYYRPEIDPDNTAYNPVADPAHPSYNVNWNKPPVTPEIQQPSFEPSKGLWNTIKRNPIKTTAGLGALGIAGIGAYALSHSKSKTQSQEKKAILGAAIEGLNMVGVPMLAYKALRQFGVPLKNMFPEVADTPFWKHPMENTVRGIGQSIYKDDMVPSVGSGIAPMLTMPIADYLANKFDPQPQQQEQQY